MSLVISTLISCNFITSTFRQLYHQYEDDDGQNVKTLSHLVCILSLLLINKTFSDITVEDFQRIYDVNLFGVVKLIKNLFEFFCSNAHIVNISSIGGLIGSSKFKGLTAYSSSKAALNVLTEVLAEEYKDSNLTFNSLCLGSVQTKMLEKAFPGYKAEVSPLEMAEYIFDFSVNGKKLFSGKVIPISKSNP